MRWFGVALLCAGCATSSRGATVSAGDPEVEPQGALPDRTPSPQSTWAGTWRGEFGGTQEFIQLELAEAGRFRYRLDTGPDSACCSAGSWSVAGDQLTLTFDDGTCVAPGLRGYSKIYEQSAEHFALADPEYVDQIQPGEDGKLSGPVWMFERDAGNAPNCP